MQSLLAQEVDEVASAPSDAVTGAPAHFGNPHEEYRAVRGSAAVRDVSHVGKLRFDGVDHLDFLHRMTTNHCLDLQSGTGVEVVFPDNRGRIVEFGCCNHLPDGSTLLVCTSVGGQLLLNWLERYHFAERMQIVDETESLAMIELMGPDAANLASSLGLVVTAVAKRAQLQGDDNGVLLFRMDCLSWPGLRAVGDRPAVARLWRTLRDAGAHPIGEEAFETFRIEAGMPAPQHELTEDHNPWECGLSRAVNMNKGCYIGQEVIARLDTYDKVKQHLVGVVALDQAAVPRQGDLVRVEEREVGTVTSAVFSPLLNRVIALGYVRTSDCATGNSVSLGSDGVDAVIVDLPFAGPI